MKRLALWGGVGIAVTTVLVLQSACGDDAPAGVGGLDAGADARGGPHADGGGSKPDPDEDLDASGDDDSGFPCTGKVVINELQTGGDGGAEFVELFNPTGCAISLGDWKLLYRSTGDGAGIGSLHTFGAGDQIRSRTFLLLGNAKFEGKVDAELKGALATEAGQVGLVDDEAKLVDGVGYGPIPDASAPDGGRYTEGKRAGAAPPGGSLGRKKDGVDTDDNAADFVTFAKHSAGVSNE